MLLYTYSNRATCSPSVVLPNASQPYRTVDKYGWMASVASRDEVSVLMDTDVVVQCTREEIVRRLGARRILLGVERNQYPVKTQQGRRQAWHVNSGVIVGYGDEFERLAREMKAMAGFPGCKLANSTKVRVEDQLCLQSLQEKIPRPIDRNSTLVLSLYGIDVRRAMLLRNGSWTYRGRKPCFVHSNGYKWPMQMMCSKTPERCLCHSKTKKFQFRRLSDETTDGAR